ncbi:MucR family transcriptional regulator [Tianweitania sp.]|uniref:MucR family transcriptional regulator n=1 Tax=Tianweitania sp. TaxID=2021634 RepID=UPI002899BB49|nr:MucR family transcriptional regulator [Tianweitania sp.]
MQIDDTPARNDDALMELTADVVAAYVSNNSVPASELPNLIADIHAALGRVGSSVTAAEPVVQDKQKPAVNPKKSVHDDYIVCLEDGKKFKSLKRHLMTHYSMTPEQYREKWGLDSSYPMVAPNYAAARSQLAKSMGLGRKPKAAR